MDFNRRFLATVPSEYDPVALREVFSPGVPGLGDDDRRRDRLRRLRAAALVPVAPRASAAASSSRPRSTTAASCSSRCAGRWRSRGSTPIRRAPGTPGWSRSRELARGSRLARPSARVVRSGRSGRFARCCGGSRRQLALVRELEAADQLVRRPAPSPRRSRTRSPRTWKFSCQLKSGLWLWAVRQARPSISGRPAGLGSEARSAARRVEAAPAARTAEREAVGRHPGEHRGRVAAAELLDPLVPGDAPAGRGLVRLQRLLAVPGAHLLHVRVVDARAASRASPAGQTKTRSGRTWT